jgi:hypothetical protein
LKTIHIINSFAAKDPETARRHRVSSTSWRFLYENGVIPCHLGEVDLPRNSSAIGDDKNLPYIHDLIDIGISKHNPEVIILSNADICFASISAKRIADTVAQCDACYSYRRNFTRLDNLISDSEIQNGEQEIYGVDMFAFKVDWWIKVSRFFPDMLLGRERWDMLFYNLVLITCPPSALVPNIIYHETHDAFWKQNANRFSNPGQFHNLTVSRGIYEKLQLLGYMRKISCNTEVELNHAIKYEVDSIDTGAGLFSLLE